MSRSIAAWAFDPRRSREKRFGADLLIKNTIDACRRKHGVKVDTNYEAERLRKESVNEKRVTNAAGGLPLPPPAVSWQNSSSPEVMIVLSAVAAPHRWGEAREGEP